jgi:hypothetical protein
MSHERRYLYNRLVFEGDDGSGFGSTDLLHTATVCLWCGEIWLRTMRRGEGGFWHVETRPCEKHGGGTIYPLHRADEAIGRLTGELLIREFMLGTEFVTQLLTERLEEKNEHIAIRTQA